MKKILRHGLCTEEYTPVFVGTDYFTFYHRPCIEIPPFHGHCKITAVIIDGECRIIFNLKCRSCGAVDVLKTHPQFWSSPEERDKSPVGLFYISSKLKSRVGNLSWESL